MKLLLITSMHAPDRQSVFVAATQMRNCIATTVGVATRDRSCRGRHVKLPPGAAAVPRPNDSSLDEPLNILLFGSSIDVRDNSGAYVPLLAYFCTLHG